MITESAINLTGAIVSIISAFWAFFSAKSAIKIKKKLLNKLNIGSYSELHNQGKQALVEVRKIGPTANSYLGIKINEICNYPQSFIEGIIENRSIFDISDREKIEKKAENLQRLISEVVATDIAHESFSNKSNELYNKLLDLVSTLNEFKKNRIEE